jgi:hypothetical protein
MRRLLKEQKRQGFSYGMWNHLRVLADHHFKVIVKPNCETLYSSCYIRKKNGPVVLRMPAFDAYFSFTFLNMNTDVMGYITNREANEHAVNHFIIAYDQEDRHKVPLKGITLDTNICWVIGRFEVKKPEDIARVHDLQDGIALIKLKDYLYDRREKDALS